MKDELRLELPLEDRQPAIDPVETLVVPMWRFRYWVVLATILGAGVGFVLSAIQPNTYDSMGKLLVRSGTREEGTTESRVVDSGRSGIQSSRETVSNELHLLANPAVFEKVARDLGPARILAPYDPGRMDEEDSSLLVRGLHRFQSWWFTRQDSVSEGMQHPVDDCPRCTVIAAQALADGLHIQAEPGSSVISVDYTANSADLAAAVVDAFMKDALVHHQAVFTTESSLSFLNEQLTAALAAASKADDALSQQRIQCGFYDVGAQRKHILDDIHGIDTQLTADAARLVELAALSEFFTDMLSKEDPNQKQVVERTLVPNPEHSWLKQRLHELEASRIDLDARKDKTAEQIATEKATIDQQIKTADQDLAKQQEFLDPGKFTQEVPNPRYVHLRDRLDEVKEESTSLHRGAEKRQERLTQLRTEIVKLEQCAPALNVLESDAEQCRQRAAQFLAAREKVGVVNQLDRMNMINLRLVQSANVPLRKSGPRRGRLLLIGGLLGLGFGTVLAFARHHLGRRLRSPADVERVLGSNLIAVVPEVSFETPAAGFARHRAAL